MKRTIIIHYSREDILRTQGKAFRHNNETLRVEGMTHDRIDIYALVLKDTRNEAETADNENATATVEWSYYPDYQQRQQQQQMPPGIVLLVRDVH